MTIDVDTLKEWRIVPISTEKPDRQERCIVAEVSKIEGSLK